MAAVAHKPAALAERYVIECGSWETRVVIVGGRRTATKRWATGVVLSGDTLDELVYHWRVLRRAVAGGWHVGRVYQLVQITCDQHARELAREVLARLPGSTT